MPLVNSLHSTSVFGLVTALDVRRRNLFVFLAALKEAKGCSLGKFGLNAYFARLCLFGGSLFFLALPMLHYFGLLHDRRDFGDFSVVYNSVQSLVAGYSPYLDRDQQIEQARSIAAHESQASAGRPRNRLSSLYAPNSLGLVVPFALLPWRIGLFLWLAISGALFVGAAFCMADLARPYSRVLVPLLLAIFLARSTAFLYLVSHRVRR